MLHDVMVRFKQEHISNLITNVNDSSTLLILLNPPINLKRKLHILLLNTHYMLTTTDVCVVA